MATCVKGVPPARAAFPTAGNGRNYGHQMAWQLAAAHAGKLRSVAPALTSQPPYVCWQTQWVVSSGGGRAKQARNHAGSGWSTPLKGLSTGWPRAGTSIVAPQEGAVVNASSTAPMSASSEPGPVPSGPEGGAESAGSPGDAKMEQCTEALATRVARSLFSPDAIDEARSGEALTAAKPDPRRNLRRTRGGRGRGRRGQGRGGPGRELDSSHTCGGQARDSTPPRPPVGQQRPSGPPLSRPFGPAITSAPRQDAVLLEMQAYVKAHAAAPDARPERRTPEAFDLQSARVQAIARGRYGQVYLVRTPGDAPDQSPSQVLKRVTNTSPDVPGVMTAEFAAELRAMLVLARARVPCVVQPTHFNVVGGLSLMPRYDCSLRDLIEAASGFAPARRALRSEPVVAGIVRNLLLACAGAHDAGLCNRDIKPENIMMDVKNSIARLGDWGLASSVEEADANRGKGSAVLCNAVTAWYRAPEVLLGADRAAPHVQRAGRAEAALDVMSIGMITAELLRGAPPYMGRDDAMELFRFYRDVFGSEFARYLNGLDPSVVDARMLGARDNLRAVAGAGMIAPSSARRPHPIVAGDVTDPNYRIFEARSSALSKTAHDFLRKALCVAPEGRQTARQLLRHPWLRQASSWTVHASLTKAALQIRARMDSKTGRRGGGGIAMESGPAGTVPGAMFEMLCREAKGREAFGPACAFHALGVERHLATMHPIVTSPPSPRCVWRIDSADEEDGAGRLNTRGVPPRERVRTTMLNLLDASLRPRDDTRAAYLSTWAVAAIHLSRVLPEAVLQSVDRACNMPLAVCMVAAKLSLSTDTVGKAMDAIARTEGVSAARLHACEHLILEHLGANVDAALINLCDAMDPVGALAKRAARDVAACFPMRRVKTGAHARLLNMARLLVGTDSRLITSARRARAVLAGRVDADAVMRMLVIACDVDIARLCESWAGSGVGARSDTDDSRVVGGAGSGGAGGAGSAGTSEKEGESGGADQPIVSTLRCLLDDLDAGAGLSDAVHTMLPRT